MRYFLSSTLFVFGLLAVSDITVAAGSEVPEPFQRFSNDSKYKIKYDDLTDVLSMAVVNVGRSTREKAAPS